MKTTRNPPSSSSQSSEAELAFCGDIILTTLFFFSLFLFSILPSLSVFSHPRDEHSPIPLYSAKDTSNEDDCDDRQTQTNKQTHHAALRDMVHAQNGRTLFRFFFYILSTASLVKIGGGSVLISLSFFSSPSLSFLQGREVRQWRRRQARRIRSLSLSFVCVCVCSFKNLTLSSECALLRVKKKKENKEEFSLFSAQTCQNQKERKNKERLQNNATIISE